RYFAPSSSPIPLSLHFSFILLPPPRSTLFPYTTLFRSLATRRASGFASLEDQRVFDPPGERDGRSRLALGPAGPGGAALGGHHQDRKSTRLNSSHGSISYAVFCLKKKKYTRRTNTKQTN